MLSRWVAFVLLYARCAARRGYPMHHVRCDGGEVGVVSNEDTVELRNHALAPT